MAVPLRSIVVQDNQISNLGLTTLNSETFNASGTFTLPTGFKGMFWITLVGAGGGGGGNGGSSNAGAGGGGGATYYRWPLYLDQSVTSSVSVTLNNGGTLGGSSADGGDGGTSTFGSYLTAYGGSGGGHSDGTPGVGGGTDAVGGGTATFAYFHPWEEFTSWGNILFGGWSQGGGGGEGEGAGEDGEDTFITPDGGGDWHGLLYSGEGEPFPTGTGGLMTQGRGGGGGAGLDNGGNQSTAPPANGGGGGKGDDTAYAGSAGAKGKCVVEWFE